MTFELYCLAFGVLLGLVYLSAQTMLRKAELGIAYDVGARDEGREVSGLIAGRADRAYRNFLETFPMFVALVAVVELSGGSDWLTQWGAGLYLAFRIIYLPLYLIAVPWLRTFSWNIATAGLALMLVGVFV